MNVKLYLATILILILAIGCKTSSEVSREIKDMNAQVTVSAWDLLAAYEANEVAADLKYKNRVVFITGTVDRFVSHEEPLVYFRTGLGMMGVSCGFSSLEAPHVAQLSKGQQVTFKGKVTGVGLFDVEVKGCSVVETEKIKPAPTIKPTIFSRTPSNLPSLTKESVPTPIPVPTPIMITEDTSLLPPGYPQELTSSQILALEGKGLTLKEITTTLKVLKCKNQTSISKEEMESLVQSLRSGIPVDTGC